MVRFDTFCAGISQDDRIQAKWEYLYGRDVAIRNGQFLELEKKPAALTAVSESWSVVSQYKIGATFYIWCSDGVIRSTLDFNTYTDLYNASPSESVLAMMASDTTLYWWTLEHMYYRTTFTDGLAWDVTNTFQVGSPDIQRSEYRQVIRYSNKLVFFTNGNFISYVNKDTAGTVTNYGTFTSGGGAFQSRATLTGLTEHANSFWAYDGDGKMYVVDQGTQWVVAIKNFKEPIMGVYNNTDFDMVFTASGDYYKACYLNGWVWPNSHTLLRRYMYSQYMYEAVGGNDVYDGIRFNFIMKASADNSFCENGTLMYFIANEWGQDVIYSYGQKNNSLPKGLSIITSKRNDGSDYGTISAIFSYNWYLYIAGNTGVTRYVEKMPLEDAVIDAEYQSSWYVVLRAEALGEYEKPKKAKTELVWAYIPTWTTIGLSYSINEGVFTEVDSISPSDVLWGTNLIAKLIQRGMPMTQFNEMAIKVTLSTTDPSVTPKLFSIEYEPEITLYQKPQ